MASNTEGSSDWLYEARNITKKYGSFTALDSMNFHIAKNEVVVDLGEDDLRHQSAHLG
jgi:ABC-type sugar transport system ATPase subunit